jgi:HEAT repeat protein
MFVLKLDTTTVTKLQREGDVIHLIELLDDETTIGKVAIRAEAAYALGDLGDGRAVARLARLVTEDNRVDVRTMAVVAIGKIGSPEGVDCLLRALEDSDTAVRIRAAESLGKIGDDRATDVLTQLLDDSSTTMRATAAEALGAIGSPLVMERLRVAAGKDRLLVRNAAAKAISQIGGVSAIGPLEELRRRSRNPVFRRLVSSHIKRLEGEGGTLPPV